VKWSKNANDKNHSQGKKTQEVLINKGISIPQETQGRPETVKH